MAKVITVAWMDEEEVGHFLGTFTQLKIALDFIGTDFKYVNGKPLTYQRMSSAMRKDDSANICDESGWLIYSFLRNEMNPKKEKETEDE